MKPPEIRALVQERMDEALGRVGGEADLEVVRRPGGKGKRPVFAATAERRRQAYIEARKADDVTTIDPAETHDGH